MPKVTLRVLGTMRHLVGTREVKIEVAQGNTVRDVLFAVIKRYGKALEDHLFDPKTATLRPSLRVLLNGQNIISLKKLETKVKDGDVITIFPPAGGGS